MLMFCAGPMGRGVVAVGKVAMVAWLLGFLLNIFLTRFLNPNLDEWGELAALLSLV